MTIEIIWKSVVLLLVGLLAYGAAVRASAALRHRILGLTFLALAILPLLAQRLPVVEVVALPAPPISSVATTRTQSQNRPPLSLDLPDPTSESKTMVKTFDPLPADATSEGGQGWLFAALHLYELGLWVFAGRLLVSLVCLTMLKRQPGTDLASDPDLLGAHVSLRRVGTIDVPMTFGLIRPVVLLPEESAHWSPERVRAVLLHEGAHVRRKDWAWQMLASGVCILYWFNPLVWILARKLRAESEIAADDEVIERGVPKGEYAEMLVDLAQSIRDGKQPAALTLIELGTLKQRVEQILNTAKSRRRVTLGFAVCALITAVACASAGTVLRLIEQPQEATQGAFVIDQNRRYELLAVTSYDENEPVSWNRAGAIRPMPLRIDRDTRRFLATERPLKAGEVERFLFFRDRSDLQSLPQFFANGDPKSVSITSIRGYSLDDRAQYMELGDVSGRALIVVRVVVPRDRSSVSLSSRLETGEWRRNGFVEYRDGARWAMANGSMQIDLKPEVEGSSAQVVLPEIYRDQKCRLVINGDTTDRFEFDGSVVSVSMPTSQPMKTVRWVELWSSPTRLQVLRDIPLRPNSRLRFKAIDAVQNRVPEVSALDRPILRDFDKGQTRTWAMDGGSRGIDQFQGIAERSSTDRLRAVRLQWRCTDPRWRFEDIWDDEGVGLAQLDRISSTMPNNEIIYGTNMLVPYSVKAINLWVKLSATKPDFERKLFFGRDPEIRLLSRTKTQVQVRIPENLLKVADPRRARTTLDLVDANGKTGFAGAYGYSVSGNKVTVTIKNGAASKVAGIKIESVPYAWQHFENVQLYPKSE